MRKIDYGEIIGAMEYIKERMNNNRKLKVIFQEASEKFNIPYWTLYNFYYRNFGEKSETHKNQKLNEKDKVILQSVCISFSSLNIPLSPKQFKNIIFKIFSLKVGKNFVHNFFKRSSQFLILKKGKRICKKILLNNSLSNIELFINQLKFHIERFNFFSENVFNYDETIISIGDNDEPKIFNIKQTNKLYLSSSYKTICSLISFIRANGTVFF